MTREEAIKNLEKLLLRANITDAYGDMEDMTPYEDAVSMAIQALKQRPKQSISCDVSDCICGNWEEDIEDELDGDLEDQFEKILESIDAGRR